MRALTAFGSSGGCTAVVLMDLLVCAGGHWPPRGVPSRSLLCVVYLLIIAAFAPRVVVVYLFDKDSPWRAGMAAVEGPW